MLTDFIFFSETLQLRVSVGFKWLPFPRSGLLLSLEPTIQIKWNSPRVQRAEKGNKPETCGFPALGYKLPWCVCVCAFTLCWYSREVAAILPSRLVTHTWVITCGWEWTLWSVLPCCFLRSSLSSQLRSCSIRADIKSCDCRVSFLNCSR